MHEVRAKHLGDGEDPLGVTDVGDDLVLEEGGELGSALGPAGRAEPAPFAGKGEQVLGGAVGAPDAGEASLEDAAVEVPRDHAVEEAKNTAGEREGDVSCAVVAAPEAFGDRFDLASIRPGRPPGSRRLASSLSRLAVPEEKRTVRERSREPSIGGHELDVVKDERPCVVVSDPVIAADRRYPLVGVVPLTEKAGRGALYPRIPTGSGGLRKDSGPLPTSSAPSTRGASSPPPDAPPPHRRRRQPVKSPGASSPSGLS
jgi:hypothetical protein